MDPSITESGDSSTASEIGNLVRSRIFGVSNQQLSVGDLIKVPNHLYYTPNQQFGNVFTPVLISIGPIYYKHENLQNMNKCKVKFCQCFIQRANIDFQHLELKTREVEDKIRLYYEGYIESRISSDDFVTMILVDGMFILEYFLRQSNPHLVEKDQMIAEWMPPILKFDLVLLQNQLPFFVLEMLLELANFPPELGVKPLSLRELAFEFFQCYNFQMKEVKFIGEIEHFTDLVRLFYLSEKLPDRRSGGAKLLYSATQLHEAGVKLKGVEFDENVGCYRGNRHFLDIRFDLNNGVLEIPCIKVNNNERVRLIKNIIALEQSLYVGHAYVTDFFVILDFLVDNSKDVDLLCDKGILINYLGDSNAAASVINSFNTNILWDYMNPEYSKICEDLNAFYKKPWHRWRATLWRQYFSTPWRAASTSAAIILLLLTAIQTVCSLKSTTW